MLNIKKINFIKKYLILFKFSKSIKKNKYNKIKIKQVNKYLKNYLAVHEGDQNQASKKTKDYARR